MCELLHTRAKKAQVVGADRQAALRDLRLGIKSESLESVMHDTPFGSPVRPKLSFYSYNWVFSALSQFCASVAIQCSASCRDS